MATARRHVGKAPNRGLGPALAAGAVDAGRVVTKSVKELSDMMEEAELSPERLGHTLRANAPGRWLVVIDASALFAIPARHRITQVSHHDYLE